MTINIKYIRRKQNYGVQSLLKIETNILSKRLASTIQGWVESTQHVTVQFGAEGQGCFNLNQLQVQERVREVAGYLKDALSFKSSS